jgi:predicted metal-dependent enzyme (double-stranded beta helix superfamily)
VKEDHRQGAVVFDVEEFVADCRAALGEQQPLVATKEILHRALSDPTAIDEALGMPERGGVVPLHRSEDLTVLQIVWPPRVSLFPHEHRMWAANGIYGGREDNTFYRRGPHGIVPSGGKALEAGDVVVLGREVIHAVVNPRSTYTAAIHVYAGDFFATPRSQWDADTLTEEPFDFAHLKRVLSEADEAARAAAAADGDETPDCRGST